mmetsp:Transcript_20505/g.38878  ORF Transcript_20505/g.38878 Transcript_20505/m.38878 type:complete len:92 (+) Transcript_20505:96-371(+)
MSKFMRPSSPALPIPALTPALAPGRANPGIAVAGAATPGSMPARPLYAGLVLAAALGHGLGDGMPSEENTSAPSGALESAAAAGIGAAEPG